MRCGRDAFLARQSLNDVWFVPELNGEAFHNLGSDGDNLKVEIHDWLAQAR